MNEFERVRRRILMSATPVEPLILFESNSVNVGFEQGYKQGGGSTNIFPESLFVSTVGEGFNTIVSTNKIDTTGYKTLKVTFSNTGTVPYTWCSLFPTKNTDVNWGYEGMHGASGVIELRVDWFIEGECYVAVGTMCDTEGTSSIATITKIELI